jgi:cytochrome c
MKKSLAFASLLLGIFALSASPAVAQDAEAGKKVFNKCKTCHEVEQTKNKVGPHLVGIVGRKSGSIEDFKYSDGMKNMGIVWNEATIAEYMKSPKDSVKGNKMTFAGLKDEQEIANLIAYLKSVPAK